MNGRPGLLARLGVQLARQEEPLRKVHADSGRDPGDRYESQHDGSDDPRAISRAGRREAPAGCASRGKRERSCKRDSDRGESVDGASVEVVRVENPRDCDDEAEPECRSSHEPRTPRQRIEREEHEEEGRKRNRVVELDECAAEPALEASARDGVEIARVEDGVEDENGEEICSLQDPGGERLALGRTAGH